jgi:hypothetical protein
MAVVAVLGGSAIGASLSVTSTLVGLLFAKWLKQKLSFLSRGQASNVGDASGFVYPLLAVVVSALTGLAVGGWIASTTQTAAAWSPFEPPLAYNNGLSFAMGFFASFA